MPDSSSSLPRSFWIGSSFLFGLLGLMYLAYVVQFAREHYHSKLPVIGHIADFTLTNQDNQIFTLDGLTNHVWVADIIFTRCGGPCPIMTGHMRSLQTTLPETSEAKLVTLTTDPDFDTPAVMNKYGQKFDADFKNWIFLTGTKKEIAALGSDSLKLSSVPVKLDEQKNPVDLFIHSTYFVVVDKHAQLRAVFETGGDGVEWTNVQPQIVKTVHQLEREP